MQRILHRAAVFAFVFAGAACGGEPGRRGDSDTDSLMARLGAAADSLPASFGDTALRDQLPPSLGDTALRDPSPDDDTPSPPPQGDRPAEGQCDPNYTPCVPIASDVDCAGGRGNGPAYVQGPVRVIGRDIYRLDRDGDGIGCEN